MGVVMVSLSAGHADVRSAAGKLSGTIRASFDSAALTGQTYRLVFSFETDKETQKPSTRKIRVEATDEVLSFDDQGNVLSRGAEARAEGGGFDLGALMLGGTDVGEMDDQLDEVEEQGPPNALQALAGLKNGAERDNRATFAPTEHDLDLGDDVHLVDVWMEGMGEAAKEGEIYLYFFPSGYTQGAYIHLADEGGADFTVRVHGLTGRTEVQAGYLEPGK
ncbi:MAG: hypothetical protein A2289_26505 [Deltaproteobacteria bacterium RIFOXYA12_FULL_58_15]|nr:MAG: hypothetical protein A2289_26505 [Deltaproteobacteria bacterium RIFOXYA12_FULL_58_15]OGR07714.1 MAG: hypothetical protein A2341_06740 [Deltaproteobacteria bacterium RIFOXYB12_FULL_58_9]